MADMKIPNLPVGLAGMATDSEDYLCPHGSLTDCADCEEEWTCENCGGPMVGTTYAEYPGSRQWTERRCALGPRCPGLPPRREPVAARS